MDRCFYSQKEPEEPARKRHGNVAELRDAAGDLLLVPELRSFLVVRVQKSRLIVIIFKMIRQVIYSVVDSNIFAVISGIGGLCGPGWV